MARKSIILILTAALFAQTSLMPCKAQTVETMQQSFATYVERLNSGADSKSQNEALWACYSNAYSLVQQRNNTYMQVLQVLQKIAPALANAAAYYDQTGNKASAVRFAEAYVYTAQLEGMGTQFIASSSFPMMALYSGIYYYNGRSYEKAIVNFKAYLRSSDEKRRKDVYSSMATAYTKLKDYQGALDTYNQAIEHYPGEYSYLSEAINLCLDLKDYSRMQPYLTKALALRPDDKALLLNQGILYESSSQYDRALGVFSRLQRTNPSDVNVVKHLAINTYNLGVLNYNNAMMTSDASEASRLTQISNQYFSQAISPLNSIIAFDGTSIEFTQALAVAYKCTGNKQQVESVNKKLASMGGGRIGDDYVPTFIGEAAHAPAQNTASYAQSSPVQTPVSKEAPTFSAFAKKYIEDAVNAWQQKDQFETPSEYLERVNEQNRNAKIAEVRKQAESEYIKVYSPSITTSNFTLKPYDAENEAFLIESNFGQQMVVPVPRQNNEAKIFSSSWNNIQAVNPEFCINNDKIALASVVFVTPYGRRYTYNNANATAYEDVQIDAKFDAIDQSVLAQSSSAASQQNISHKTVSVGKSDVDMDIPEAKHKKENTYAVIVANENYLNVAKVPLALNDGSSFKTYCEKALGIPKENITYYADASYGMMLRALRNLNQIASTYSPGGMNVVFYYAGHGLPDEATRQSYLLPIDGDGQSTEGCYPVDKLYTELAKTNAGQITVFLDACFSGAQRGEGMLASARGVALKAKPGTLDGNMVVFSAASADETAMPYTEKNHGLFTYYLLKKLKESNGDISLGDLSSYLIENVSRQSIKVNSKLQTPVTTPSGALMQQWQTLKIQ